MTHAEISSKDQKDRRGVEGSEEELQAPTSDVVGETRRRIILEMMKTLDQLSDKAFWALNRSHELNERLEEHLEEFSALLEHGVKVVSLFSQKLLEKNIHEAQT